MIGLAGVAVLVICALFAAADRPQPYYQSDLEVTLRSPARATSLDASRQGAGSTKAASSTESGRRRVALSIQLVASLNRGSAGALAGLRGVDGSTS